MPKKPSLGFWNSIAYGLKWLFTFGNGDTEAHRQMPLRREQYEQEMALYPERKKAYDEKLKAYNDYLNGGEKTVAEYEKKMADVKKTRDAVKNERTQAEQTHREAMRGNDSGTVNAYRSRLETRLEGVNDLRTTGRITA